MRNLCALFVSCFAVTAVFAEEPAVAAPETEEVAVQTTEEGQDQTVAQDDTVLNAKKKGNGCGCGK